MLIGIGPRVARAAGLLGLLALLAWPADAQVPALAQVIAPGAQPHPIQRRETILVTGSSTVFPFSNAVAARFVEATGRPKPFIDGTGTVRGYNLFCQGAGLRYPDIANASRRMNAIEFSLCAAKGVHEIIEIPIGYDGMVFAMRREAVAAHLTREQIWRGVAREVPVNGQFVANPHRRWRDIDARLPDWPIEVLGPPPTSGTRDSFVDLVMNAGCATVPEVRAIGDAARRRALCASVREDGLWIDAGEDDEKIVARLVAASPGALQGVFGYSFLVAHADRLQAAGIEATEATVETIAAGRYPLARPLFIYVKKPNLRTVPGLDTFIEQYIAAIAPGHHLERIGLVPLPAARLDAVRASARGGAVMQRRPPG